MDFDPSIVGEYNRKPRWILPLLVQLSAIILCITGILSRRWAVLNGVRAFSKTSSTACEVIRSTPTTVYTDIIHAQFCDGRSSCSLLATFLYIIAWCGILFTAIAILYAIYNLAYPSAYSPKSIQSLAILSATATVLLNAVIFIWIAYAIVAINASFLHCNGLSFYTFVSGAAISLVSLILIFLPCFMETQPLFDDPPPPPPHPSPRPIPQPQTPLLEPPTPSPPIPIPQQPQVNYTYDPSSPPLLLPQHQQYQPPPTFQRQSLNIRAPPLTVSSQPKRPKRTQFPRTYPGPILFSASAPSSVADSTKKVS